VKENRNNETATISPTPPQIQSCSSISATLQESSRQGLKPQDNALTSLSEERSLKPFL